MHPATARLQKSLIRLLRGVLSAWEDWINEMHPGDTRPKR